MKRDMKKLEDKAAASAKAASESQQRALQQEENLKKVTAELDLVKKQAAAAESASQKTIHDMSLGLNNCRKGSK